MLAMSTQKLALVFELVLEFSYIHGKVIRKTQAHAASLGTSSGLWGKRPNTPFRRIHSLVAFYRWWKRCTGTAAVIAASSAVVFRALVPVSSTVGIRTNKVDSVAQGKSSGSAVLFEIALARKRLVDATFAVREVHLEAVIAG
ncbi:hypothetical protein HG531_012988 [Fusarium graminearum]|nr:hypothetical protein HG531_012988 [Fusarium graminearum]